MKKANRILTILIFIFLYIPMAVLIVASFNTGKDITRFEGFTLMRYVELFRDEHLLQLLRNSVVISILATATATTFGTIAALGWVTMSYLIALYATVMLLNKKLSPIPAYDKTIVQLSASALIILPYILFSQGFALSGLTGTQWVLLVIVGVVHTGIAYALYFGSMEGLPAHTIAIFSYLDPVIAVLLSALLLREPLGIWGILGAVLILGSALYSELPDKRKPPV